MACVVMLCDGQVNGRALESGVPGPVAGEKRAELP